MNDAHTHRQIWELLPWIANHSATPEQHQQVDSHLPHCSDCREELALQRRIHAGMNQEAVPGNSQAAFARLLERIDAPVNPDGLDRHEGIDDDGGPAPAVRWSGRRLWSAGIAALLVMQSAALALMAYQLHQRPDVEGSIAADYQTLSRPDASSPSATIRLVPDPELSVRELQKLLDDAGLRIVDSRSGNAIYGLAPLSRVGAIDPELSIASIAKLRGKPGVLLVEPIAVSP